MLSLLLKFSGGLLGVLKCDYYLEKFTKYAALLSWNFFPKRGKILEKYGPPPRPEGEALRPGIGLRFSAPCVRMLILSCSFMALQHAGSFTQYLSPANQR